MTLALDIAIILLLFFLFGLFHSVLASKKLKEKIANDAGDKIAFYRLFYNITSVITLLAAIYISPKPDIIIYDLPFPYDLVFWGIQALAIIGFYKSASYINLSEFLGIEQIRRYYQKSYNKEDLDEKQELSTDGWLKFSRHPIYFFSIIIITFRPAMNLFDLLLCISFILYFVIGAHFEEKKLIDKFGNKYLDYKKNVPMFFPYKLFSKK